MKTAGLEGKVAVITGSSRGIGKAVALELARQGALIVINGRNAQRLMDTENEIRLVHTRVISVCCDVSAVEGSNLLISETIAAFHRIDILINNVGISMRGLVADLKPEVLRTIFETNVYGTMGPTIAAIKYLRITKGSIVFISSVAGIRGLPFTSAYCSSKMALRAFAESIRIEEAENKIHVGLIFVGVTEIDKEKVTLAGDGSVLNLQPRKGKGVLSKDRVAKAVLENITKRKFMTVMTSVGKLNAFLQARFPMLVERIIIRNIKKFEANSR